MPRHRPPAPAHRTASLIAEIPHDERPRERLLRTGARSLADSELVAVLLRGGRPGASVLELARELLDAVGGLAGLATACPRTLRRRGVGEVKTASLLAAIEIARRLAATGIPDRRPMSEPRAVAHYIGLRYARRDQEVLGVLYVDTRNRLIGEDELFRGTLSRAAVEPRPILRQGLLRSAAGVVLFHTHPSGDPTPSREDLTFTRRMADAGKLVGIRLVDHLIVGAGGSWLSLRDHRGW